MKPSNFIANSDYLCLAQKNNSEFTAIFPPETFSGPTTAYDRHIDFKVPSIKGAIDEIMISYNGSEYLLGASIWTGTVTPAGLGIIVSRISPDTIRVNLHIAVYVASYSMPMQTYKVRVSSFLPPNIF